MPPHCDSLDGPVVTAARDALTAADVEVILPDMPAEGEDEIRVAFAQVLPLHTADGPAADVCLGRRAGTDVQAVALNLEGTKPSR